MRKIKIEWHDKSDDSNRYHEIEIDEKDDAFEAGRKWFQNYLKTNPDMVAVGGSTEDLQVVSEVIEGKVKYHFIDSLRPRSISKRQNKGCVEIYLDAKDSIAIRYLMEYEPALRQHSEELSADDATDFVVAYCIQKLWEVLDNLELFQKYGSIVVVRSKSNTDVEFNWQTVCDRDDYRKEQNTKIWFDQRDFILLEACLRRAMIFVTKGRIPDRDEMIRIALRFRATTIRFWNNKTKDKKELGINAPRGLLPIF